MDITPALEKAANWLVSIQKADGSFGPAESKFKGEPHYYSRNIVLTAQAIRSLVFSGSEFAIPSIKKALWYCANYEVEGGEPYELLAIKLSAMRFSNCYSKECSNTLSFLQQQPVTSWKSAVNMPILTNFHIISSIPAESLRKNTSDVVLRWLEAGRAKDGLGWGPEPNSKSSVATFTANAILSYVKAGGDPNSKLIQTAKKYLESEQESNGSWKSSGFTIRKPTVYATAICTMSLMISSPNPLNSKVQAGINYLLNIQNQDGGWSLVPKDKSELYVTYFTVWCLSLYKYMKEKLSSPITTSFPAQIESKYIVSGLFREFETFAENRFKLLTLKALLNSKALGSTNNAIKRRRMLLKILAEKPDCTVADLIDELKVWPEYMYLKKKSHITQIKADLDHLIELGLVQQSDFRYSVILDMLNY